jgi:hypothetical protein
MLILHLPIQRSRAKTCYRALVQLGIKLSIKGQLDPKIMIAPGRYLPMSDPQVPLQSVV